MDRIYPLNSNLPFLVPLLLAFNAIVSRPPSLVDSVHDSHTFDVARGKRREEFRFETKIERSRREGKDKG